MTPNFFWSIYKNLEDEFLNIANYIHIDDRQLDVYSLKIADLLVRTVVEVEALSKELFFANGGALPEGQDFPYFDSDCINLLNRIWLLDQKVVNITCASLYMAKPDNLTCRPLKHANKQGAASSDWNRAY